MRVSYENYNGEKLDMTEWPLAITDITPLFGWEWEYETSQNRISSFTRGKKSRKIKISVFADTKEEFNDIMNKMHDIIEFDILNKTPGKLWCDGYYMKCYLIEAEMEDYEEEYDTVDGELRVETMQPVWILEKSFLFKKTLIVSTDNKRYPGYKYPYRYANGLSKLDILNDHFSECNFKIIIYGSIVNPLIIIGGYRYYVEIVLEEGEYLEIDSANQTVIKVMNSGIRVNCFHNRDKKNSVFRKIQKGRQEVSWSGKFDFDVVLFQERSEPKWK